MRTKLNIYNLNLIITFLLIIFNIGCKDKKSRIDWKKLRSEYKLYPQDSVKLEALEYLEKQLATITSQDVNIVNSESNKTINLRELSERNFSEDYVKSLINERGYSIKRSDLMDSQVLTTKDVKTLIDEVFKAKEHTVWGKDIPKNIFFEYLLSYKVSKEYPSPWRKDLSTIFERDYKVWADTASIRYSGVNKTAYIDTFVNKIILPQQAKYYRYSTSSLKLGTVPSYLEIQITKSGDCFSEALINNYLFKAAGIPASYDIIPYWGSANGTHATAVYYNPGEHKMRLIIGLLYYPAKVFRRTFSERNVWTKEILPVIGDRNFKIDLLKSDRLIDVTDEHTSTTDLKIATNDIYKSDFAYITVLNYGNWVPIFWGEVNDGFATFKKMGYNMIYRVAVPDEDGKLIYGEPFYVDLKKKIIHPDITDSRINLSISATNQGKNSRIQKGHNYVLYILDKTGEMIPVKRQVAMVSGQIIFENVAQATFYKVSDNEDRINLSRIFSLSNGEQVWH